VPALVTEVRGPFGIGGSFLCRVRLEGTDEADRADFELREDALDSCAAPLGQKPHG